MGDFTEAEKELLKNITKSRLRSDLERIREAAEDIWAEDSPRVVQFFTDHGIRHCERLAGIAYDLLKANNGSALSSEEMYLLLAGIYLHDIGMQCDILRFPKIKERAEALGAEFGQGFATDAKEKEKYSPEMQKEIRDNHQILTAAWIDCAYSSGDTTLGPVVKEISSELIDDLIDVCKHHSKLPIANCGQTFKYNPNGRKQLVASLLRFSDELDIDAHRVTFATVKNFSIDSRSGVYWWLHNRTKVNIISTNVIQLLVRLHRTDLEKYGSIIQEMYINEFQTKNRPILTVLGKHGIPIVISDESKVIENDREEEIPLEIAQVLKSWNSSREPLFSLADEIRIWMQAIHYELSDTRRVDERTAEFEATLEQGTVRQRLLIRCIDGEISAEDVRQLDETLDRKIPQGWLISDKRVSTRARDSASQEESIQVFNLSEFLKQKVWGPYIDALTSLVKRDRIPEYYVDLACYKYEDSDKEGNDVVKDENPSLDGYIDNWLSERGKMHISLLGEFGTGKTWFCRHYAYRQLDRYLKDPANERLPLLITLRTFAKSMTPQQLINDALLEQYKLPFLGSAFEVFREMNRRGKILLILDGFDEMAKQVVKQTVIDNFWELANLVDDKSKVILTSRTEYFRWAKEAQSILGGEEYGRSTIVLSPPKFEVVYLEPFDNNKITDVIIKRLGAEKGPATAKRILEIPNLAEMARKPVLIELLLASMDEISQNVLENQAQIYLYATNKLLMRNIKTERTFTTTADKLYFLCELAWEMIRTGQLRINYKEIPKRIENYFGEKIKNPHELDNWDFDLRNQTLLHRDAAGYYEFAHKSLAEYFVAFKFAAELGILAPRFSNTYCESDGHPCKISIEEKVTAELIDSFGSVSLIDLRMKEAMKFLIEMTSEDDAERLWDVLSIIRGKSFDEIKYLGGNVATLLSNSNQSFANRDLSGSVLVGADLRNCDLTKTNLKNAILRLSDLRGSRLKQSDISSIILEDCRVTSFVVMNQQRFEEIRKSAKKLFAKKYEGLIRYRELHTLVERSILSRNDFSKNIDSFKMENYLINPIIEREFEIINIFSGFKDYTLMIIERIVGSEEISEDRNISSNWTSITPTTIVYAIFDEEIKYLMKSLPTEMAKNICEYKPQVKYSIDEALKRSFLDLCSEDKNILLSESIKDEIIKFLKK